MANTRFGNFSELSQGKKPMTAKEAWIMLNELGLLGQEFVPGATSVRKLMEGKPREAVEELQDWIPGNAAYQNFINGKDQDWVRNALDLAIVGKPLAKGAKKAAEAIERMPKGGKEGYIQMSNRHADQFYKNRDARHFYLKKLQERDPSISDATIKELDNIGWGGYNDYERLSPQAKEVLDGIAGVNISGYKRPANWDKMSPEEQLRTFLASTPAGFDVRYALDVSKAHRNANYKRPNSGPIYDEVLTLNDLSRLLEEHPELMDKLPGKNKAKISDLKNDLSKRSDINVDVDLINSKKENVDIYKAQREREAQEEQRKALLKAEQEKRLAEKAVRKAAEQAAKEAKWKAEREAAAKAAEEKRLAKEAEERRIAEEAEKQRLAEEAEAKRIADEEEEFERQFREEEAAERNRYADSVGTALGMEAVNRDIDDWLIEKMIADEEAAAKALPITTTQVEDMSTGILPGNVTNAPKGGHRNTYDHSRQFMDSELKQVPGIDRTGMSYGDNTDAFYDLYKAWRDNPGRENQAIYDAIKEAKSKPSRTSKMQYDPYYNAGIVGDLNNKLWKSINNLRGRGYSDEKIREKLKNQLDEYQGKLERFKARMPSSHNGSMFDWDGAITTTFHALPSEEARALKALGVDTPEYDELERLGNFYRVFFPK